MYTLQCLYSLFFLFSFASLAIQDGYGTDLCEHDEHLVSLCKYEKYKKDTINQLKNSTCPIGLEEGLNMENGILIRTNGFVNQGYLISEAYSTYIEYGGKVVNNVLGFRVMKQHELERIRVYNEYQTKQMIDPAKVNIYLVNEAFNLYVKLKSAKYTSHYNESLADFYDRNPSEERIFDTFLQTCLPLSNSTTISQLSFLEARKIFNIFLQRCMTFESITSQSARPEIEKLLGGTETHPGTWALCRSSTIPDDESPETEDNKRRTWKLRILMIRSLEQVLSIRFLQAEGYGICSFNIKGLNTKNLDSLRKMDIFETGRLWVCYPNLLSLLESTAVGILSIQRELDLTKPFEV